MTSDDPFRSELIALGDDMRAGLAFLTRLPQGLFALPGDRPDFRRGARVFPLVGVLVGIAGGIVLMLASELGQSSLIAAALGLGTVILVTGALHEDGLADTVDGFGGGATAERKLEIMDDARIGAFGTIALVFSILFRVGALSSIAILSPFYAALALVAAEAVSRAALVRLWHVLPAARLAGLAHDTGPPDQPAMIVALAIAAVVVVVAVIPSLGFWAAVAGILLAMIATYIFTRLTAHEIGGRTGDTLGACQQIAAIAFLIGVAAFA